MFLIHQYLWIAGTALCGVTLGCGFWKGRASSFPLFFAFLSWQVVSFLVQLPIQYVASIALWKYCNFLVIEISFLFEVAMLYQLAFMLIFCHSRLAERLQPLSARIFVILTLLAVFFAAILPTDVRHRLFQLTAAQDFLELGVLITLAVLTRILGLSWRGLPAGVSLGWGISSAVNIAAMLLMSHKGGPSYYAVDTIRLAGFHVCVLVWLWYVVAVVKPAHNSRIPYSRIVHLDREVNELHSLLRN